MDIKILGMGCSKCKKLYEAAKEAVGMLGMDAEPEKVEDIVKIMSYGVMNTPALVINGRVKASGSILKPDEIAVMIKEELQG